MDKLFAVLISAFLVFFFIVVLAALFAIVTQWLWAGTVVELFHAPELSLLQAWKLNVLSGLMFRGISGKSK